MNDRKSHTWHQGDKQYALDLTGDDVADGVKLLTLRSNPVIEVVAADEAKQQQFADIEKQGAIINGRRAMKLLQNADDTLTKNNLPAASGSLHTVLDAFHDAQVRSDGIVNDYGKTLQRQCEALRRLLPDVALSQFDQDACEKLYKTLRERPTKTDGSHYSKKYCQHLISCLTLALEAADTGEQFQWELPQKFHRIKTKQDTYIRSLTR